jgi:hypothetical protein
MQTHLFLNLEIFYFETAQNILNVAQQGGSKGWSQADGNQNRYF